MDYGNEEYGYWDQYQDQEVTFAGKLFVNLFVVVILKVYSEMRWIGVPARDHVLVTTEIMPQSCPTQCWQNTINYGSYWIPILVEQTSILGQIQLYNSTLINNVVP